MTHRRHFCYAYPPPNFGLWNCGSCGARFLEPEIGFKCTACGAVVVEVTKTYGAVTGIIVQSPRPTCCVRHNLLGEYDRTKCVGVKPR